MQKLLCFKWSDTMTCTSSSYCSSSDFSCPLWLGCCTPAPKNLSGQESRQFDCVQSQRYSLWRNEVLFKQWDQLPSFLQLKSDTLVTLACTCKYEQTRAIFCIMHYRVMELKFCSDHNDTCNQKNIKLQLPNAKLCEALKCSCLSIFQLL